MDNYQQPVADSGSRPATPHPEIVKLVESRLRRSSYLAVQRLVCEYCNGVLTLRGHLPSYYLKQVALAVVATVAGVQHINDHVEVAAQSPRTPTPK